MSGSRRRFARASSTRGIVNDRSVAPPWPTFWTIMSTLMPASASGSNTLRATPGLSGTSTSVILATFRSCASPRTLLRCSTSGILPDLGAGCVLERAEDLDGDVVDPAELDGAGLHHLGALVGELHHLLVADDVELPGAALDARIGGVDARDVGVDLAAVGVKARGQGDGRRVRAAAAQRGDLGGVDVARGGRRVETLARRDAHALEAGDDDDLAGGELGPDAPRVDARDARLAVAAVRGDAGLRPGQADRRDAQRVERHRHEGRALVLAGREQDVELARVGLVRDGRGERRAARRSCRPSRTRRRPAPTRSRARGRSAARPA